MPDFDLFDLGDVVLQSGSTLPHATLAYRTYGTLNSARDNVVVLPTFYGGDHTDNELMMAPGRAIDPSRYFVVVPNMFGNGRSSSPSNTPEPLGRAAFPAVTLYDNVMCQHRLITERFGVTRIRLVVGFSMGAQQAFHWGALFPDMVGAIAPICGSAKTSPHNIVFLEGVKAALTADAAFAGGWYDTPPVRGLDAFGRVYAGWVYSQDFYRDAEYRSLGLASIEDVMRASETRYRSRDANDLLAMLWTWQHADISANPTFNNHLPAALRELLDGK
jgi:homoserine O-acetyltransferase